MKTQADITVAERRKGEFTNDPGYYLVPASCSIPGLGQGFLIVGSMTNIQQSHTATSMALRLLAMQENRSRLPLAIHGK